MYSFYFNELYSLCLKFSALCLLQDFRKNFYSCKFFSNILKKPRAVKIVSNILKKAQGRAVKIVSNILKKAEGRAVKIISNILRKA